MAKIVVKPDCGNAPRKLFLKHFNTALANGKTEIVSESIADDIKWDIPGSISLSGKENFLDKIKSGIFWKVKELTIETIITHGPDASVSGSIVDASGEKFSFCDIYKFSSAGSSIIRSVKSYIIEVQ